MSDNTNTAEYQAEYDKAAAALDAAAQATTARGTDGKFAKAETPPAEPAPPVEPAPVVEAKPEPVAEIAPPEPPKPDPIAELTARVERAEKIARDNQAWATKASQEAATLRRQQEAAQREAAKPTILNENPELADAIRYVASDPAPQLAAEQQRATFQATIEAVHPDAFAVDMPEELQSAISSKWSALGDAAQDPLAIVRVITEEKLAFAERQIGKRFAAEAAKLQQKSAMSVPSAGAPSVAATPIDVQVAEVQRIQNMSDADFRKEVARVKGY